MHTDGMLAKPGRLLSMLALEWRPLPMRDQPHFVCTGCIKISVKMDWLLLMGADGSH